MSQNSTVKKQTFLIPIDTVNRSAMDALPIASFATSPLRKARCASPHMFCHLSSMLSAMRLDIPALNDINLYAFFFIV